VIVERVDFREGEGEEEILSSGSRIAQSLVFEGGKMRYRCEGDEELVGELRGRMMRDL